MKTISVVTPCFNERESIRACHDAVKRVFSHELAGYVREHIVCDNASTDGTVEILRDIAASDPCARVILNAENVGPLRNAFNGVLASTGDAVVLFLPADLQDPPELLPEFVRLWQAGHDIVYGIRAQREEPLFMRCARASFYRILLLSSNFHLPVGVGDYQLIDRKIVPELQKNYRGAEPFMRLMTFEAGGRAIGVPHLWRARKSGKSKNNLLSLIRIAIGGLFRFASPWFQLALVSIAVLGLALSLAAAAGLLIVIRGTVQPASPVACGVALLLTIITAALFGGLVQTFLRHIWLNMRPGRPVLERERINFPSAANVPETCLKRAAPEHSLQSDLQLCIPDP